MVKILQCFRRGGLATLWLSKGEGWALGRNLIAKRYREDFEGGTTNGRTRIYSAFQEKQKTSCS